MDATSNSQIIQQDKTLADYIDRISRHIEKEKSTPMSQPSYPVFPEDDGTDQPKNPYSPV